METAPELKTSLHLPHRMRAGASVCCTSLGLTTVGALRAGAGGRRTHVPTEFNEVTYAEKVLNKSPIRGDRQPVLKSSQHLTWDKHSVMTHRGRGGGVGEGGFSGGLSPHHLESSLPPGTLESGPRGPPAPRVGEASPGRC